MSNKVKYIIFVLFAFFTFNVNIRALTYGGCEYNEITKLKKIVSNVNLSYDYEITNNNAVFSVTLNNIVPGIYFEDISTGKTYTYNNTNNGEITINGYEKSGKYRFYSDNSKCYGIKLGEKYYNLPSYNIYYTTDLCKENSTYNLCQKWAGTKYSYVQLSRKIKEYKEGNKEEFEEEIVIYNKTFLNHIIDFYVKYYYVILIAIIVICVTVMIISRKKNSFKL